jgi:hypothetical protein
LGLTDAKVLAVSSSDEMALLLHPKRVTWEVDQGTLARAAVGGGAPREVAEDVLDADWSPDGKELAIAQVVEDRVELQFPPGHVLYAPEAPRWISSLRMSPRADRIAFIEHAVTLDIAGDLRVVDLSGRVTTLAKGLTSLNRMTWSADGEALWLTASRTGGDPQQIYKVDLRARARGGGGVAGGLIPWTSPRSARCSSGGAPAGPRSARGQRGLLKKRSCPPPTCPSSPISPTTAATYSGPTSALAADRTTVSTCRGPTAPPPSGWEMATARRCRPTGGSPSPS